VVFTWFIFFEYTWFKHLHSSLGEGGMPAYTKEFPVPAVAALCKKMMKALQRHEDKGKSKAYFALKNEVSSE